MRNNKVASAQLHMPHWGDMVYHHQEAWLRSALDPAIPVIFLSTDKVGLVAVIRYAMWPSSPLSHSSLSPSSLLPSSLSLLSSPQCEAGETINGDHLHNDFESQVVRRVVLELLKVDPHSIPCITRSHLNYPYHIPFHSRLEWMWGVWVWSLPIAITRMWYESYSDIRTTHRSLR